MAMTRARALRIAYRRFNEKQKGTSKTCSGYTLIVLNNMQYRV